jgi:hypothetical protein
MCRSWFRRFYDERCSRNGGALLTCITVQSGVQWASIHYQMCKDGFQDQRAATFSDRKPYFRIGHAELDIEHVEVIIDDKGVDREPASRILQTMADRLLECNWHAR